MRLQNTIVENVYVYIRGVNTLGGKKVQQTQTLQQDIKLLHNLAC